MAEPARARQAAEPIILDIHDVYFDGGHLWQPRYPTLINYEFAPDGFQFEPAFLVRPTESEVTVSFQLAGDVPVVFAMKDDGTASWVSLVPFPESSVEVSVSEDGRTCRVVWKRPTSIPPPPPITSLRIVCERLLRDELGDEEALDRVEGGVYLTIISPEDIPPTPDPAQTEVGPPPAQRTKVRFLGIDELHRPVYDLFKGAAPFGIALEPAIRAGHGEHLCLPIALDLPDLYAAIRFKTTGDQVDVSFRVPQERPDHLIGATAGDQDRECTIEWSWDRPEDDSTVGRTANFSLQLVNPQRPGRAVISVDPTVIEPPPCDASGICTPPRNEDSRRR